MKKRIEYRNMDSNQQLDKYVDKSLAKIDKLVQTEKTPQYLDLVITAEHKDVLYSVTLNISTPDFKLYTQHEGEDVYEQIDKVMDAMLESVRKAKEDESDHYNKPDYYKSA